MFEVSFGKLFAKHYANFPSQDQDKIDAFIEHYQEYGFVGLTGKNVESSNVSTDDPDFIKKLNTRSRIVFGIITLVSLSMCLVNVAHTLRRSLYFTIKNYQNTRSNLLIFRLTLRFRCLAKTT